MSNTVNLINRSESKTSTQLWRDINWVKVERKVFKLQKRIYKAETVGDIRTVRRLQNTLTNSWYAKLLAIRRVTQDNRGQKTAGIDGVKSLNDSKRMDLAKNLNFSNKAKPARRVWIPKPGKTEKRPLGIPVMEDRARQALLKFAIEPQWEARFEPHSYGFRPARSCHDALKAIYNSLSIDKWVLDADIAGCFDNINHQYLLDKVNTTPRFRKQIKAWLKAGTIDWFNKPEVFSKTTQGTPQGGVISPLLANIALHGLEDHLKDWLWNKRKYRIPEWNATKGKWGTMGQSKTKKTLSIVRYADDFVVIHKDLEIVIEAKDEINEYLKEIGLEMKDSKTQIVNSKEGFNFLGVNIRHFETGVYRSEKNTTGNKTGLVRLLQPSKDSISRQYRKIADIIDGMKNASQEVLISKLNPIILGFSNYHKYYSSTEQFQKLDSLIFKKLLRWAKRRHPNKGMKWVVKKYFFNHNYPNFKWLFGIGFLCIRLHNFTLKERYIQVKGEASIFDGETVYWGKRVQYHPELSLRQSTLIKRQKGICTYCNKTFKANDIWETDHIIPKCRGGKDIYDNLQLLHAHCHDKKSRQDRIETNLIQKPLVVVS